MVDEEPVAMVIGSFVSISLEPPLAGFFCTSTSSTWAQLKKADVLGVNVLGAHQIDVSNACMRPADERFDGLDWEMVDGAPRIAGCTAWIALSPNEVLPAGDHEFAMYNVTSMNIPAKPTAPVAFYGGAYRSLAATD